ncbi:hypothetical protein HXW87_21695 [Pseudomonas sp. Y5-11]|jgi:hypothetical protein|uniref:RloB family protein n=1 Tax=Pseudomonas sp. Y5-11 TaxID=2749808 RepID=UPI001EFB7293|nr:RloB family protein [Pseudomonas sp. Y5-11]ULN84679.1 hypothetical protein HXW87_21695 [Pseudomonas sp. Y5-11]
MGNHILLVFEGQKTEPEVFESLRRFYLNDLGDRTFVIAIYGCEIYSLYHKMKNDEYLDLFLLLKSDARNKDLLKDINKDQVSEIYLLFDYDGHAPTATDDKLLEMLGVFNEETERGKLYISYPMVESLKHLPDNLCFSTVVVPCKQNIQYKALVGTQVPERLKSFKLLEQSHWKAMLEAHCKKLNHLITGDFSISETYVCQHEILSTQIQKHIKPNEHVAVLSAFPIFVKDYYGAKKLIELIEAQ